jgi:hypothetical protein
MNCKKENFPSKTKQIGKSEFQRGLFSEEIEIINHHEINK